MNRREHLLACLAEECGEVVQVVGKMLRFGETDKHPKTGNIPNNELLLAEMTDVIAVLDMLQQEGMVHSEITLDAILAKQERVKKNMKYATQAGTLQAAI